MFGGEDLARLYRPYKGSSVRRTRFFIILFAVLLIAAVIYIAANPEVLAFEWVGDLFSFAGSAPTVSHAPVSPSLIISTPTPTASVVPPSPSDTVRAPEHQKAVFISDITDTTAVNGAVQLAKDVRINTVVIDMKPDSGKLGFRSSLTAAIAANVNPDSDDYLTSLNLLTNEDLFLVARISVFKDASVPKEIMSYSVKTANGVVWYGYDSNTDRWMNPYSQEVFDYTTSLCSELLELGFDEIILDNFSFPTLGQTHLLYFPEESSISKEAVLHSFAADLSTSIASAGGVCSFVYNYADFVAWQTSDDFNLVSSLQENDHAPNKLYIMFDNTDLPEKVHNSTVFEQISTEIIACVPPDSMYNDPAAADKIEMYISLFDSEDYLSGYTFWDSSGYYPSW